MTRSDIGRLLDRGLLTVGHVRHVIAIAEHAPDLHKQSRVNRQVQRSVALQIFRDGATFAGRDDADILGTGRTPRSDRMIATNVLREFGNVDGANLPEVPR